MESGVASRPRLARSVSSGPSDKCGWAVRYTYRLNGPFRHLRNNPAMRPSAGEGVISLCLKKASPS
ncbi:hypothetical protein SBA3_700011 [Candidatus Sulfopaludibacter sp. SbA3]|nr:hypothetical protein SBA3_700011 [Candidatus Sulfopaludibacter sp. SbA3]